MLQNYAKFDSRIASDSLMENSISSGNNYYNWSSFINYLYRIIWDVIELIIVFIVGFLIIFWIFLFLYIIISLFSKGWAQTIEDLKKLLLWFVWLFNKIFSWFLKGIKKMFLFLWNRKFLSIFIILLILLFSFSLNVINWESRLLKIDKINTWYVWVDLENNKILNPGYHLYSPLKTNYFLSPTNNFDFEIAEVTANTKEDLWVTLDYRVGFIIKNDKRLDFYKTYWAKNIQLVSSDIVMPRLLEVIKWIIRNYWFRDISSKHNEIKGITITEANKVLIPIWIELNDITILDIRLPKSYLDSKEELLKSENELKLAEARLEAQIKESEKKVLEAQNSKQIKIIEAEGIAEYNKIISNENITDDAIEMKKLEIEKLKIEKWDWKLPTHTQDWSFEL